MAMESLFGRECGAASAPPGAPGRYARVAVERGLDTSAEGLTYAAGWDDLAVGERVEVLLGRGIGGRAGSWWRWGRSCLRGWRQRR
ncbi:MAG: hypothetical protein H6809_07010 [Phycisphaeraceae bacterium]|nr:hypothetical protein [Phycisphaeraceae bacterium]